MSNKTLREHRAGNLGSNLTRHVALVLCFAALAACAARGPAVPSPAASGKEAPDPRALGERLQKHHRALYDRHSGTYDYYAGGVLYAKYHPWKHWLSIRTDRHDGGNLLCHYSAAGKLTMKAEGKGAPAPSAQRCTGLLEELSRRMAR